MNHHLKQTREIADKLEEEYNTIYAEDRLLDKEFRKKCSDVHGLAFDFINKAYKRRTK